MPENKHKRSQVFTNPLTGERTMGNLPRPHRPPTTEQLYEMHKERLVKQGIATAEQIDELKKEYSMSNVVSVMVTEPKSYKALASTTEMSTLFW